MFIIHLYLNTNIANINFKIIQNNLYLFLTSKKIPTISLFAMIPYPCVLLTCHILHVSLQPSLESHFYHFTFVNTLLET